jgi:hypothetical protein
LRVGHAGHSAIQTVKHHGAKHPNGGHVKTAIHGHHDGIKATEQGCQREQVGQDVNALAGFTNLTRLLDVVGGFSAIVHATVLSGEVTYKISCVICRPICF